MLYRRHAQATVDDALRVVDSADVVVSDRLHAHVLCTMLGIPHVMLDTRYGKVRAFVETWTYGNNLVELADSASLALDQARRLLPALVERG
jgi:exopolysaccharide biosynthesis predicted pyruvyltransferase EpsI